GAVNKKCMNRAATVRERSNSTPFHKQRNYANRMTEHIFTGFGFGPIQGGLFVREAFQSGNFTRTVAAEIDAELVDTVRANKGSRRAQQLIKYVRNAKEHLQRLTTHSLEF
ncbi:unnamed protein product, partial [marine sediment metagenome]